MWTLTQPCDGKRSASSADIEESEISQITSKILRFQLNVPANNAWDLPTSIAYYLRNIL